MQTLDKLKRQLKPGKVYRRAELAKFSSAVDRHLNQLVKEAVLRKLTTGVYYCPKKSTFGEVPPDEQEVLKAFLKDNDFLVMSLNRYNSLSLGTTQLYNERLVYNHKRDGHMELNGQKYYFLKNRNFPKRLSDEFLLVDVMNNVSLLAENLDEVKQHVANKTLSLGIEKVCRAAKAYGKVATQKFFEQLSQNRDLINAR